jgi:hypothetical protein
MSVRVEPQPPTTVSGDSIVAAPAVGTPPGPSPARIPKRFWAAIVAVTAASQVVVPLAFSLFPSFIPDPASRVSAQLRVLAVDSNVTYGDYLRDIGAKPPRGAQGTLRAVGATAYVSVRVQGRKHRHLDLFYSVYNARTRVRYRQPPRARASYFRADTPNDRWISPTRVPRPGAFDRVFARLQLYDRGAMLAFADTPVYRYETPSIIPP